MLRLNPVSVLLLLSSPVLGQAIRTAVVSTPFAPPSTSSFVVPTANQCNSLYDRFYASEPGVYAYWAACETTYPPFQDTAQNSGGQYSFLDGVGATYGVPQHLVNVPNPFVPDGEQAQKIIYTNDKVEDDGFVVNTNAGTFFTWINTGTSTYPMPIMNVQSQTGSSGIALGRQTSGDGASMCFTANWTNSAGAGPQLMKCGYTPNTSHRLVLTWTGGNLSFYVDAALEAAGNYTGALDNSPFYYQLLTGSAVTAAQMTIAKSGVSNQAWSAAQVAADFVPDLASITPPTNGVLVTNKKLGTIHRDVFGYNDAGEDIQTRGQQAALMKGLATAGITSIRYANGFGGINADRADWQMPQSGHMVECNQGGGSSTPVNGQGWGTGDNIDKYIPMLENLPQDVSLGYTVNYGSNPPACNAGGDPVVNGANLVKFLNKKRGYGFKYFSIGNEQWACNTPVDLHPNPYLQTNLPGGCLSQPSTYPTYFPAFYTAMKAVDPSIQISVPISIAGHATGVQTNYSYPVLALSKYWDLLDFHIYPLNYPIEDGKSLYQERLASGTPIRGPLLAVQTALLGQGKSPEAFHVGEWSGDVGGGSSNLQDSSVVEALFSATQLAEFMRAGVQYATRWTQRTPNDCTTDFYHQTDPANSLPKDGSYVWLQITCASSALIYTGAPKTANNPYTGMQPGDPYPAARGFQTLLQSGMIVEGEHMLQTYPDPVGAPWLQAYGATHGSSYAVILINRDRDAFHTVPVHLDGKPSWSNVKQTSYGVLQYDFTYLGYWGIDPVTFSYGRGSGNMNAVLPPWSVNVLVFGN